MRSTLDSGLLLSQPLQNHRIPRATLGTPRIPKIQHKSLVRPHFTKPNMVANWLGETPLNLACPTHPLPQNPEIYLPTYAPLGSKTIEEHVTSFKSTLCLLDVQHEDVACRYFSFTL